jgi:hypothetical protein
MLISRKGTREGSEPMQSSLRRWLQGWTILCSRRASREGQLAGRVCTEIGGRRGSIPAPAAPELGPAWWAGMDRVRPGDEQVTRGETGLDEANRCNRSLVAGLEGQVARLLCAQDRMEKDWDKSRGEVSSFAATSHRRVGRLGSRGG